MTNRCDLRIEFDNPTRRYKTGEEVTGFVTVDVNNDCLCRSLRLDCQWRTLGPGKPNRGSTTTDIVFKGEWTEGVHRYPFSFFIPNGPCSYKGQLFAVEWYICAQADIPWPIDPREEVDFLVEAGEATASQPYLSGDPASLSNLSLEQREETSKLHHMNLVAAGAAILLMGLLIALMAIVDGGRLDTAIIALFSFAMGGWLVYVGLQNRLARIKLEDIRVQFPQKRIQAGGLVEVLIDIPSSKAHINAVTAKLIATELITTGMAKLNSRHTKVVYEELTPVFENSADREVPKDEPAHFSLQLPLSGDAPPSFHAKDHDLHWEIEIHVEIARWPDWKQKYPLEVLPAVPRALDEESAAEESDWSNARQLTEEAVW